MPAPIACEAPSAAKMTRLIAETLDWAIRKAPLPAIQSTKVVDGELRVVDTFSGTHYRVTVEELS